MTRVLLTGNSHTLPFLEYLKQDPDLGIPRDQLTTFVAPQRMFRKFEFDDTGAFGVLNEDNMAPGDLDIVKQVNSGKISVNLADYEKILLIGARVGHEELAETLATHDVLHIFENERSDRISLELFDTISRTLVDRFTQDAFWQHFPLDRLIFLERPLRSSICLDFDRPMDRDFAAIGRLDTSCEDVFMRHAANLDEAIRQSGAAFVAQPASTLDESGLTAARFSQGVSRLAHEGEFPEHDAMHMNAEYGEILWARLSGSL